MCIRDRYQRFRAAPVEHPRWYAEGDMLVAVLAAGYLAILVGPVLAGARRVGGRRGGGLAPGVRLPLISMAAGAGASLLGFVVYLGVVANLAQNYRTVSYTHLR